MEKSDEVFVNIPLRQIKELVEVARNGIDAKVSFFEDVGAMRAEALELRRRALTRLYTELSMCAGLLFEKQATLPNKEAE